MLPEEIEEKLSNSEKEYFKNHSATLQSYMSELDLDLTVVSLSESLIVLGRSLILIFCMLDEGR